MNLLRKQLRLKKSVGGIKETITKVENNQSSFDKRVTEVEKTANGITQNVSKLQETQTQQGKTLTQATTTLEQHSEALNLTMKKKDVENYVGGLEPSMRFAMQVLLKGTNTGGGRMGML